MSLSAPKPGSHWLHKDGGGYPVEACPDIGMVKIPGGGWLDGPWVQYRSYNGDLYIRTLANFLESFTQIPDAE